MATILVIEDNAGIRENLVEMLTFAEHKVKAVNNGRAGLSMLKQYPPDIVICDVVMPEVDGYEVLTTLKSNPSYSLIPFIFLTALAEEKEIKQGLRLGANRYLIKPFEEVELLSTIESLLSNS